MQKSKNTGIDNINNHADTDNYPVQNTNNHPVPNNHSAPSTNNNPIIYPNIYPASNAINDNTVMILSGNAKPKADNLAICRIKELLSIDKSIVNIKNTKGATALQTVCKSGNLKVAALLIDAGANINNQNNSGKTALLLAINNNNNKIVKLLIDAGADINLYNKYKQTALMAACKYGRPNIVDLLIKTGADINAQDSNNYSCLMLSIMNKHRIDIIKLLIAAGAYVNAINDTQDTCLMNICRQPTISNALQIIDLLIDAGADVNLVNNCGQDVLCIVCNENREIIMRLINAGSNINFRDKNGNTFLMRYVGNPNADIDMVSFIIRNGAKVNVANKSKNTPLMAAIYGNNNNIVKLLIDNGADVNICSNSSITPLKIALTRSMIVSKMLIEAGADIYESNIFNSITIEKLTELLKFRDAHISNQVRDATIKNINYNRVIKHVEKYYVELKIMPGGMGSRLIEINFKLKNGFNIANMYQKMVDENDQLLDYYGINCLKKFAPAICELVSG